jgi:hypothetical protein
MGGVASGAFDDRVSKGSNGRMAVMASIETEVKLWTND